MFMLESIFEPFVSTKPNGTGLGLTMVRSMVERGRGNIHVDSSSEGTVFTLSFPTCSIEDFDKQDELKKSIVSHQQNAIPILVLDDDRLILSSIARSLKESGFHVHQAENVAQAKELLLHNDIKLVLSDINMPGESVVELYCYCVKEYSNIAFVLMTGLLIQEDFPDIPIMEKPISAQDLIFQINKELKSTRV